MASPPPEKHDPAAFAAEVARRVRSAVVHEVPKRRGTGLIAVLLVLGILAAVILLVVGR